MTIRVRSVIISGDGGQDWPGGQGGNIWAELLAVFYILTVVELHKGVHMKNSSGFALSFRQYIICVPHLADDDDKSLVRSPTDKLWQSPYEQQTFWIIQFWVCAVDQYSEYLQREERRADRLTSPSSCTDQVKNVGFEPSSVWLPHPYSFSLLWPLPGTVLGLLGTPVSIRMLRTVLYSLYKSLHFQNMFVSVLIFPHCLTRAGLQRSPSSPSFHRWRNGGPFMHF